VTLTAHFAGILATASLLAAARPDNDYKFRTFEVCKGCPTETGGINDRGLVGALRLGPSGPVQGYVFNAQTSVVTPVPGALAITVPSNSGRVPGLGLGVAAIWFRWSGSKTEASRCWTATRALCSR
jgi:hypothetical protein